MLSSACSSCFPPLAEGQSGRLGRRLYSRLTPYCQTTCHGLSARITRDSPEERNKHRRSQEPTRRTSGEFRYLVTACMVPLA